LVDREGRGNLHNSFPRRGKREGPTEKRGGAAPSHFLNQGKKRSLIRRFLERKKGRRKRGVRGEGEVEVHVNLIERKWRTIKGEGKRTSCF